MKIESLQAYERVNWVFLDGLKAVFGFPAQFTSFLHVFLVFLFLLEWMGVLIIRKSQKKVFLKNKEEEGLWALRPSPFLLTYGSYSSGLRKEGDLNPKITAYTMPIIILSSKSFGFVVIRWATCSHTIFPLNPASTKGSSSASTGTTTDSFDSQTARLDMTIQVFFVR